MGALTDRMMRRPGLGRFLGALGLTMSGDAKRATAWQDYGYPEELGFNEFFNMFSRNGIARAGVMRHVDKSWQTAPWIIEGAEGDDPHDETPWERDVARLANMLQLWPRMHAADWRNRVGRYAALYLVFDDGVRPDQPVQGGARRLLKVQPLFESQLEVRSSVEDPASPDYGMPAMYTFKQAAQGDSNPTTNQNVDIHPDRIHVLAEGADDGGVYGISALEAGYNDLLTLEKIIGAGGEGFWKAARGAMSLEGEADIDQLSRMFGVDADQVADRLNETASDFASGMDKMLMLGGMKATPLTFSVPTPKEFFDNAMQSFAASVSCPLPILLGQQISQRSSEENADDWIETITSRRRRFITPNIADLIRKLMRFNVIAQREFYVEWEPLDSPSAEAKLANAEKMSAINRNAMGTGEEPPFRANEIREAAGYEASDDDEEFDDQDNDDAAAGDPPQSGQSGADDPPAGLGAA